MSEAVRRRLPDRRGAIAFEFDHSGLRCRAHVGLYDNGQPAELFLNTSRQDSALDTFAADIAILISLLLQHGATVPEIGHALRQTPNGKPASLVAVNGKRTCTSHRAARCGAVMTDSAYADESPEIPAAIVEEIAMWRRLMNRSNFLNAPDLLRNAAAELLNTRRISKTDYPDVDVRVGQEIVDALDDMATRAGIDPDEAQQIFAEAVVHPRSVNGHDALLQAIDDATPYEGAGAASRQGTDLNLAPQKPIAWVDFSNWDNEPVPHRKWAIRDRVPLNQAGLFSGEGGTGKSIIELTKNVAHVTGKSWLGSMPEIGTAIYIGAEDDDR